ncbi:hypothetical protein HOLleu_17664 [Holothuria leucospilota]|uniref:Helix-turn-helix domain-containing protein n=1 Tax=Holothuria leucospilota TaxID=206669 RepID=A0A9Q1C0P7_HOLLE|nr:hypothetical protein HOLleu_17664 [Holothuria leucospilota]
MLSSFPLKPLHYYRYIDGALESFKTHVSSFHKSIKFTFEVSSTQIAFLEILMTVNSGAISASLYCKPTDKHLLLHFDSTHPANLKKSIVYSQCLRNKRICSDPTDYDRSISSLTGHFLSCGYPMRIMKQGIRKTALINRHDLLSYKNKTPNKRIPLVFEFHPLIPSLTRTLKQSFASLKDDPTLSDLFADPPLLALRQPPNLRRLIAPSKLLTSDEATRGNTCCNKQRCQICRHINTGERVTIPNIKFPLKPPILNCDSCNVVYIFHCNLCKHGLYVGETRTSFRLRFNNHKKVYSRQCYWVPSSTTLQSPRSCP